MSRFGVAALQRSLLAVTLVAVLAACGGGGGGGGSSVTPGGGGGGATPSPAPSATPLPSSATASVTVTPAGPATGTFGPILGGISGSATVPAASTTATLTETFSTSQPAGTPTVQSMKRRPQNIGGQNLASVGFVTVTSNVAVNFATTPSFTITLPFAASTLGAYSYVGIYDPSNAPAGWTTLEGPGVASGSTVTFNAVSQPVQLKANTTYVLVFFTLSSALPTPSPTSTPIAAGCIAQQTIALTLGTPGGGHGGGGTGTSAYSLTSNPSGVCVLRVDPTGADATVTLKTAATDTAPTASHQWQYQFAPSTAGGLGAYAVTIDQVNDGPRAVFYNQAADSKGTVNAAALQSVARRATSAHPGKMITRRFTHGYQLGIDPDHLAVRYRSAVLQSTGRNAADVERAVHTVGHAMPSLSSDPLRAVSIPSGISADAFAAQLRARSDVAEVSAIHRRIPLSAPATPVNDPHAIKPDQWYLFADGFPNAWSYGKGANVTIAVIDTGVDQNNTDLASKLVHTEKINNGSGAIVSTTNVQDTNGHGTNVAGVAAAQANDGLGFAGGGYNVKLMAFDIFPDATSTTDQQGATTADEAAAINDAVASGADVINLSLGSGEGSGTSDSYDVTEHDAVEYAIAHGVAVVAAAGNNADGGEGFPANTNLDYPAAYDGVIAVGASTLNTTSADSFATASEVVTTYSQYGPNLAVVAPGGDGSDPNDPLHWIWNYSTSTAGYALDQCSTPSPATSCTAFFAGTSQATPQVSAAAALLISLGGGPKSLSPARVAQLIESTADNINDPHQGHGRLNVYRAMAALANDTGAYTGPQPMNHSVTQAIAFAYANSGANAPTILDYNFPSGVPIFSDGTFRIADVRPSDASSYHVGVWYDSNGNGVIDQGDYVGVSSATCTSSSPCAIGTITLAPVNGTYALP